MRQITHKGVTVWGDEKLIHVFSGVDTASWMRMDKAGWKVHLMDSFKKQSDKEVQEALRIWRTTD